MFTELKNKAWGNVYECEALFFCSCVHVCVSEREREYQLSLMVMHS